MRSKSTLCCDQCHRDLPREAFDLEPGQRKRARLTTCRVCSAEVVAPGVVRFPLTHGKFALIDREDAERVLAHRWYANFAGSQWYVERRIAPGKGRNGRVLLHRFLLNPPDHIEVDHENLDPLDNRKSNLRLATGSQNRRNLPLTRANTSGYKGVSWNAKAGRWESRIKINGRNVSLGCFGDVVEAARAYDDAVRIASGGFARLNFPRPGEQGALDP